MTIGVRSSHNARPAMPVAFMIRSAARTSCSLVLALVLGLAGCVAPVLLMPDSSQVIWALLKPLVGFDPNTVNLWEQPVIRQRMTTLLGARYAPVMQIIRTANELKQEGPLFYVVSRFTPVPDIADKAGLVWNKDTNQFAALLHKDGVTEILSEKLHTAVVERATAEVQQRWPQWPTELAPLAALAMPPAAASMPDAPPTEVPFEIPAPPLTSTPVVIDPPSAPPVPQPLRAPITGPTTPLPPLSGAP